MHKVEALIGHAAEIFGCSPEAVKNPDAQHLGAKRARRVVCWVLRLHSSFTDEEVAQHINSTADHVRVMADAIVWLWMSDTDTTEVLKPAAQCFEAWKALQA